MKQTGATTPTRGAWKAALSAVAFLAVLIGLQSPAQAHAVLVGASPAANTVVQEQPSEIVLTFSESITPVNDRIRVVGPDGQRADTGKPVVSGATLRIPLQPELKRGTYLVSFRVISADSHPVPGGYTFSYGEVTATPGELPADEPENSAISNVIKINKYLGYLGLVLLVGAVSVLALLWPARLSRRGPVRLMWTGFGLVGLTTLAGIYLQAPYTTGKALADVSGADLSAVMSSQFGVASLVRLAVLAVGLILVRPLAKGISSTVDRVLVVILGGIGALTYSVSGHPAASPVPPVSVVVDALHLGAAAFWLGGLVMLAVFLLRQADEREASAILPVWSRWAGLAVSIVLLAGVVSALIEVGTATALVGTPYGRWVMLKIGLVLVLVGVAALSRRLVTPSGRPTLAGLENVGAQGAGPGSAGLENVGAQGAGPGSAGPQGAGLPAGRGPGFPAGKAGDPDATADLSRHSPGRNAGKLRRLIIVELAIAALVLGVTAVLTQTTPARTAEAIAQAPPESLVFTATANSPLYKLQVEVDPAKVGNNSVHLWAYKPDGQPLPVVEWKATAALPSAGIEPIDIPTLKLTENHVTGAIQLPTPGEWVLRFTLRISEIDQDAVTVTVTIK